MNQEDNKKSWTCKTALLGAGQVRQMRILWLNQYPIFGARIPEATRHQLQCQHLSLPQQEFVTSSRAQSDGCARQHNCLHSSHAQLAKSRNRPHSHRTEEGWSRNSWYSSSIISHNAQGLHSGQREPPHPQQVCTRSHSSQNHLSHEKHKKHL
jgi:hypothetical protein